MPHNFFEKSIRRSTALQTLNKFRHVVLGREKASQAVTEISILRKACETLATSDKKIDELDTIVSAGFSSSPNEDASISAEIIKIFNAAFSDNKKVIDVFSRINAILSSLEKEDIENISIEEKKNIITSLESIIHKNSISEEHFKFGSSITGVKGF